MQTSKIIFSIASVSIVLFVSTAACVITPAPADTPSPVVAETIKCPTGKHVGYKAPGCASTAVADCLWDSYDACGLSFCSCDGKTVLGCEGTEVPFSHRGACELPDATPDAPASEGGLDSAPPSECPSGKHVGYKTIGCGQAAVRTCLWDVYDACARSFCSCDGTTIFGCEGAAAPFASEGPCEH